MNLRNYAARVCMISGLGAATAIASFAQNFEVVKGLGNNSGGTPSAPLVQGFDGNYYGTTESAGEYASGTAFKLSPAGVLSVIHNFCHSTGCPDGSSPLGGLVQGQDGDIYGTTWAGGANDLGSVFKINPSNNILKTIYSFCPASNCPDGAQPQAGLLQASDGFFYGTTLGGGANGNAGTIFRIGNFGGLTTIYSFCITPACLDGAFPRAVLVQGTDGDLYGTTESSGANGHGTVFKITTGGVLTTLYSFCVSSGCPDGSAPFAGVVQGADGNFYGTTTSGGGSTNCSFGCGTIFKVSPEGAFTTLHSFVSTDGATPFGLVAGTDGNFYGTTQLGGVQNDGTIFRITPAGQLTTQHNFVQSDGIKPEAALMQATTGDFYGTTSLGGGANHGSIFELFSFLPPFVSTLPSAATEGQGFQIIGSGLTGTTSVTVNGVAATFIIVSDTLIDCGVPSGATTGPVQVVTPGGTLTSNVPFQVLP